MFHNIPFRRPLRFLRRLLGIAAKESIALQSVYHSNSRQFLSKAGRGVATSKPQANGARPLR